MSTRLPDLLSAVLAWGRRGIRAFGEFHRRDTTTIEQRLFRGLTLLCGLMAVLVVVPLNVAQHLPGFINACVLAFGVVSLGLYGATFRGFYGTRLIFFLHMANLDLIWFSNAGSQGSIGLYFFAAALYLVIFFQGSTRWQMLGLYFVNGPAMLWLEMRHPEWLSPFQSPTARYVDLFMGFVMSSLVCVLILWIVLAAYHQERERLQAALRAQRESEARFKALVMHAPIPICVSRPDGRLDYLNEAFEQVLGYTLEDLPDIDAWWERAYPDPALRAQASAHWLEACTVAVATGTAIPATEYPVVCKDGRRAQVEIQAAIIGDQWLVMFTDVSDRRRGEETLRQTQKLESLGVLAGGIAHDFNNLLSAMLGNLNMAQAKSTRGSDTAPFLENMEGAIRRAAELTRQMLAYSGKGHFVVEPMDLNRLVSEITHLLTVSISKKVRLEYDFAQALPAIEADSVQVQQVVMNLVTNASEAIGEAEGRITIGTGFRELSLQDLQAGFIGQELEPGPYVTLRVSDSGCGMAPEVLARIFDPFYSTKGVGRGLGLSAMLGILRGHQAGIEIHTEPGAGSVFLIHFRASQMKLTRPDPPEQGARQNRFQGRVLLVDDEPDLRLSYTSMLEHLGFQVVSARDGFEALERFRPGEFTLVFMDLTMPRMDGKEAFTRMRALDPEARVVLASGYSEREAIDPLPGLRPSGFIQKPFSLQTLTRTLEQVLE